MSTHVHCLCNKACMGIKYMPPRVKEGVAIWPECVEATDAPELKIDVLLLI